MDYNDIEILLADDNDYDADLITHALNKGKMAKKLLRLRDGQEALEFIFAAGEFELNRDIACPPKLILLDLHMPKIDGMKVLQRIKCSPLTKTIPVVILTSSNDESDIQLCYNMGANSYIIKSVDYIKFSSVLIEMARYWLVINKPAVINNLYLL